MPGTSQVFNHNLGVAPELYAVELLFQDSDDGWGINRRNYGGLEANGKTYGAYWSNLTSTSITINREANDNSADLIRVQVWVPATAPSFDSGWRDINPGQTLNLGHALDVTATDLTVGLWFKSAADGINHRSYGGRETGTGAQLGAYWHNLTNTSVQVTRFPNDVYAQQVRLYIVNGATPAYDSLASLGSWQSVATGSIFTFTHNLNWPPEILLVRGECRDPAAGGEGINQLYAGGVYGTAAGWRGAHIQNLTSTTVQFVRRQSDVNCPQARLVIAVRGSWVNLPSIQLH